jgi:DNA repair protein RadD|nr:MAG TPA: Chromatin remodeling complex ATPase [Caudoviricetes sp.]
MTYKLRDYQQQASDAAIRFFSDNTKKRNAIEVLPTGAGKSLVIADIASRLEGHTLVFQPSKEILEQNYMKLCSYGVLDCSIYSASFGRKEISRVTFATIGSVKNHPELFQHFRNIIIDECHLVNPKEGMYKEFLTMLRCKVLGLTATPYRLCFEPRFRIDAKIHYPHPTLFLLLRHLPGTDFYTSRYGLSFKAQLLSNEPRGLE